MIYKIAFGGALSAIIVAGALFLAPSPALAQRGFGYGGGEKITFCKSTGSVFNPYIKMTLPAVAAERILGQGGGILPDAQGNCPKGVSIREYFWDRFFQRIFG